MHTIFNVWPYNATLVSCLILSIFYTQHKKIITILTADLAMLSSVLSGTLFCTTFLIAVTLFLRRYRQKICPGKYTVASSEAARCTSYWLLKNFAVIQSLETSVILLVPTVSSHHAHLSVLRKHFFITILEDYFRSDLNWC